MSVGSFDDDEDSTASQEYDLEDWFELNAQKEARKKLVKNADMQHHKLGLKTEEIEMATSPADRHPKSRQMDQKSSRVEPATHHLDKNSKESRKTSQEMGRRLE